MKAIPTHKHKHNGTLYIKVTPGGGGLSTVVTIAGSKYIVETSSIIRLKASSAAIAREKGEKHE